ncbi:YIP1 family protein [Paenimyroides aestuarii]|uniref:YIP1 family protein n=1 Tax=Paenimyroides aestuarii TaxID=2968490 RepID=A0ABY5NQ79_9FLAO|nr:YIP1 family protein [Paenimyroides aestuarii]UUV20675.1 YIP1 family protein [Paenimyroides aestuarii]
MKKLLQILKNPFALVEDKKLFFVGISTFIIGILLAYYFQLQQQILRLNISETPDLKKVIIWHLIIVVSLTIAFFTLGKIINKKTRFIDILNTVLIALIPIYISFFQNFNNFLTEETEKMLNALKDGSIYTQSPPLLFIFVGIAGLVFFIYYIYLLFIGFKTATNAKKTAHYALFFVILFFTDAICSFLINSI